LNQSRESETETYLMNLTFKPSKASRTNEYHGWLAAVAICAVLVCSPGKVLAQGGSWTTNLAVISARGFGAAAAAGGKVYMVGGGTYSCGVFSTLQGYDPVANAWTNLANMPTSRYEFGAAELNGLIYAIGGNPGCGPAGSAKRDVEAYNPAANSWSTKALLPVGSWGAGVASANGKIYVIGGGMNSTNSRDVYCYDPTGNSWSQKASVPAPYVFGTEVVVNGIIYVIGGSVGTKSAMYAYNPVGDSWTTKTSMPTARENCAGAAVNGIIYVAGGTTSTGAVATVEAYNPVADTWSTVTPLPFRVYAASAASVNGTLYVMGGLNTNNVTVGIVAAFTPSLGLTNIVVTPVNPVIGVSSNQQFIATAYFSDGSTQNLTNGSSGTGLLWSSSNTNVATITTNGVATGLTNGVTTITAASGIVSNNASLTVVAPPAISVQPTNNTVSPNGNVTISVSATGGVLSYQWQLNGTNISGATGASLTVTNVSSTNIGVYTVIVNNAAGSVTSRPVTLASVDIKLFAGVIVTGPLGSNYLIQATSNLLNSWTTLTNVALPTQPYIYIDYGSPTNRQQFYRAVPQ
jgi:N-acetylneuraminic acid mutarotase